MAEKKDKSIFYLLIFSITVAALAFLFGGPEIGWPVAVVAGFAWFCTAVK